MTEKTPAEKALDEREKHITAREREVAAREKALPAEAEDEDLTPYPTQAMNDARARGETATYKHRSAKSE